MEGSFRKLSSGMHGEDVRLLQNRFKKLGFDISDDEINEVIFGSKTENAVKKFQERNNLKQTGIVDKELSTKIFQSAHRERKDEQPTKPSVSEEFIIQGRVVDADAQPFAHGLVRAFDKSLRAEKKLGSDTITDADGSYMIRYIAYKNKNKDNNRSGAVDKKSEINIRIAAYDSYSKELASSPIRYSASSCETMDDLGIPRDAFHGPSEYERLVAELNPLLEGSSLSSLAELTEDEKHHDITFLAGKIGLPPEYIAYVSWAHRLQKETELEAEIYYGFFRQGLPTQLPRLLAQSPEVQRRALELAVKQNIIPFRFGELLDGVLKRLTKLMIRRALEKPQGQGRSTTTPTGQPRDDNNNNKTSLGQLLSTVLPDRAKQEAFLSAYIKHLGPISEFWKALKSKPGFGNRVENLQFTFQLAMLTKNHRPLIKEIQRMRRSGEITSLSDLARLDKEDWLKIISRPRHGGCDDDRSSKAKTAARAAAVIGFPSDTPGKDDGEKAANYARTMAQMVEDISPTAFIARRMERAKEDDDDYFADMPGKRDLLTFLKANPEFDFKYGRLESYLAGKPNALENVSDVEGTKSRIKTMQRLYKLTRSSDHMSVLMKDGPGSAHAIARMGENAFMAEYGDALGGSAAAKAIHGRAMEVQAKAITLLAEHGIASYKVPMSVLPDEVQREVKEIPDWSTLFGSLDLCQCEHCKSVYSPAAYLVDVLHFLNNRHSKIRKGKKRFKTVKEVLFDRRADIGDIALTCENVNTPLPYVDLVNETLENAVWRFKSFSPFTLTPRKLEADLNRQSVSKSLRKAFNPPLSSEASITIRGQGEPWALDEPSWSIDDLPFTYTVRKEKTDNKLHVVSRSLQTKGSASERGASPQYINTRSYDVLRQTIFPWTLPFHFWDEEVRTYLGHLGVMRHQIMETFLSGERKVILNSPSLTREHLGISTEEANLITGVTKSQPDDELPGDWNAGVWNLWGFGAKTLSFQHSISDPSDSTRRITSGNWFETITERVDVFLQQSGLKYHELLDLLDTVFVNPLVDGGGGGNGGEDGGREVRAIQISSKDPNDPHTCEIDKLQLTGLNKRSTALKIMRFVRLWRKMAAAAAADSWTMRDLDRAITALGAKELDDTFISQLSHIQRLCSRLNLPVVSLLTFWAPIDTASSYVDHSAPGRPKVPSLYAHLFRNKTVSDTLDPAFPEEPNELDKLSRTLTNHAQAISNSLGISPAEFQLFLESPNVIPRSTPGGTKPDDKLNLEHLSLLYRHSILAKALKIPIRDYISLLELFATSTQQPFGSTAETVLFVENVDRIKASPLGIPELDYLLLPPLKRRTSSSSSSSSIAPTEEAIAAVLDEIRAGIQRIISENSFNEGAESDTNVDLTTDPNGTLTRQKLALLNWDSALVEKVLLTLNGAVKYQASLAALPSGLKLEVLNDTGTYEVHLESLPDDDFSFPPQVASSIRYDNAAKKVIASRFFSVVERALLRKASSDANYKAAIEELFKLQDDPGLQGKISYDNDSHFLEFSGIMTRTRLNRLKDAVANKPANRPYRDAIDSLFDAPRRFVSRYMHTFSIQNFSTERKVPPSIVQFPKSLKDKVYFEAAKKKPNRLHFILHFIGVMTEDERNLLLKLSTDSAYQSAVNDLFDKAEIYEVHLESLPDDDFSFPPQVASSIRYDNAAKKVIASRFFSVVERALLRKASSDANYKAAIEELFKLQGGWVLDNTKTSDERFLQVLKRLLPHLQQTLSEGLVKQKIAESFNLEYKLADELLTQYINVIINSDPHTQNKSIAAFVPTAPDFLAKSFAESNPNVRLTRDTFPDQFDTFTLLHKIATIITKFQISSRQLFWVFEEYGPKPSIGWLDLNKLPITTEDEPAPFDKWLKLLELFRLCDVLPSGELILDQIFKLVRTRDNSPPEIKKILDNILNVLSKNTRWDLTDLEYLVSDKVFKFTAADFQDESALARLWDCFSLIKGLKMSAKQCRELAEVDDVDDVSLPKEERENRRKRREARSRSLRQTIRARYDGGGGSGDNSEDQWLTVAKPLRDLLREKQRTALVDYLVAHLKIRFPVLERPHPVLSRKKEKIKKHILAVKELQQKLNASGAQPAPRVNGIFGKETHRAVVDFQETNGIVVPDKGVVGPETWSVLDMASWSPRDKNDLYAHYLIDVEMSPCMMTSRIKQAISSIQLFVQRCFMNLEGGVEASVAVDDRWAEWNWMKNYRVWEANRKIFLYPENWIEPELRDDKSPFFKELEGQLLQGELTDEVAEAALMSYLTKLDQVARLEIIGTYHQVERDTNILHVFGRTLDVPHVYYYRQLVNSTHWGPLEEVDVDIEGNHLAPVVWNRRLYLFWITFMEKPRPPPNPSPDFPEPDPTPNDKYYELKIAWSERQQNKWLAKKVSSGFFPFLYTNPAPNAPPFVPPFPADLGLSCRIDNNNNLNIVISVVISPPPGVIRQRRFGHRVFRFNGSNSDPEAVFDAMGWWAYAPQTTIFNYNFLEERSDYPDRDWPLFFPASSEVQPEYWEALKSTPGNFRLLPPHEITWLHDHPSFYMDKTRLFFISPGANVARERRWWQADGIDPASVFSKLMTSRYNDLKPLQASTIPHIKADPQDPLKVNASFPIPTDRNKKRSTNLLSSDINITALTTAPVTETGEAKEQGARNVSVLSANRFAEGNNGSPASTIPYVMEATELTLSDSAGLVIRSHPNEDNSSVGGHIPAFTRFVQDEMMYRFKTFYHPYVRSFIRELNRRGIEGLFKRDIQVKPLDPIPILEWPHPILRLQDPWIEGPAVKELETKLNAWGVQPQLTVDGAFGPGTQAGVIEFHTANKIIPADGLGVVDEETWSLLDTVPSERFRFSKVYAPTSIVSKPYPVEVVDFRYGNPYALYNWELFFHVPLLIADRLGKNQRFAEAQKWFHRIFDPTGISNSNEDGTSDPIPQRYWVTKPFYETTREDYQKERIQVLLKLLAVGNDPEKWEKLSDEEKDLIEEFRNSIDEWRKNPFKPHLIARMRSTAYQKTVVMKYIDNLIAWGDQLFRRETIESINEATQLYILAAEILGRKPEEVPARARGLVQSYTGLEPTLDEFSNTLIQIEEFVTPSGEGSGSSDPAGQPAIVTLPTILYFCIPKNDELLRYWDTVADRLFKIRHCMNIKGTVRQLPLFEPPIDPALLVKAAAAGIDISSVLNDINAALPNYRFSLLAQKASELCAELKSLGAALLATLEKKDAEELALIRAEHETSLLKLIELVKEKQHDEAVENELALRKSRDVSIAKYMHYQKLLAVQEPKTPAEDESIPDSPSSPLVSTRDEESVKMIQHEIEELDYLKKSDDEMEDAFWREKWANIFHLIPNIEVSGFFAKVIFGGQFLGNAAQAWAGRARAKSAEHSFNATMASRMGQYILRAHEWKLQSDLAAREIMQIDKQLDAAEIRKEITEQELSNHIKQIENAREVEDFMRGKYTNQELYSWMLGQISAIYFQSYQLAYDVAKRAETAYRFELGLSDSNFIQFGYWDSLKRGLLAGERLYHDIKRMEVAYLDQNQREYEITKHVSLSRLDPLALAQLKQTGECFVSVPEALFDLDCPGHYLRRLKFASLTVPCVTGPYVGVNCTLTLLKSSIRHSNSLHTGKYSRLQEEEDPRFRDSNGAIQSIVTSSAQNDSGLFETNLRDERYLPFEGSGAISEWHVQLPKDFRQFDYDTISDVVLHLRYTAREGGEPLKNQVVTELQNALNEFLRTEGQKGLALPISLRHEFPSEWHRFLNPQRRSQSESEVDPTLTMNLGPERFPFMFQGRPITINKVELFVKVNPDFTSKHNESTLMLSLKAAGTDAPSNLLSIRPWNGLLRAVTTEPLAGAPGPWTVTGWLQKPEVDTHERIDPNAIEDILVVCHYSL